MLSMLIIWGVGLANAQSVIEPFVLGREPQTFVNVGWTAGASLAETPGIFAGGTAGISRITGNQWVGATADILLDTGSGINLLVGPKVGLLVLGVDAGFAARSDFRNPIVTGGYGRAEVNLGVVSWYYRAVVWPVESALSTTHQLGVSMKFPQQLGYKPRVVYR